DYQLYRDFAENKGDFHPGISNITILDKEGKSTTLNAPMPDFSSVTMGKSIWPETDLLPGIATLIAPQYVVSVNHNRNNFPVKFGYNSDTKYKIVERKNDTGIDFMTGRLDKLVTEVIPATVTDEVINNESLKKFTYFYRVGGGDQRIWKDNRAIGIPDSKYMYLTGGILPNNFSGSTKIQIKMGVDVNNLPLSSHPQGGDSGSPLFGYNSIQKRWELVGVAQAVSGGAGAMETGNVIFTVVPQKFTHEYTSSKTVNIDSKKYTLENINHKDSELIFSSKDGELNINGNIDSGSSSMQFHHDYIVKSDNNGAWKGAGVIVDKGASVTWQVNGFKDDDLHKIGEGTLIVNGTGVNPGGLNVGDGTVILNQQKSDDGHVQAFSDIKIVSGRPTVILDDSNQVNPDNISWGYRGGILDVNGNNLIFHQLNAADYGAILTNNNGKTANISLEFGDNLDRRRNYIYHGQIKGNMNIANVSSSASSTVFDGEVKISGNFTQQGGKLELQGHPVIHASSDQYIASFLKQQGDKSVLTTPTSFTQDDWESRTFSFNKLTLKDAHLSLGRNAILNTNIFAENSTITLGDSQVFIDNNDGSGQKFNSRVGNTNIKNEDDKSIFNGSIIGEGDSQLELSQNGIWNMTGNSNVGSFTSNSGALSFVSNDNWFPKVLKVENMNASNMKITLGVDTTSYRSDRIEISAHAQGAHNTLDLTPVLGESPVLKQDLILASAPVGTSHDYFLFSDINKGFSVYKPNAQIVEKDGKVLWQLKSNDLKKPQNYEDDNNQETGEPVNDNPLLKGQDNNHLLRKARDIFSNRNFILADSTDRWEQIVDNSNVLNGIWVIPGYGHGEYGNFDINQKGLNLGFKNNKINGIWWGGNAESYHGYSRKNGYKDDFNLWGLTIFAGKKFDNDIFIDGSIGYRGLKENYSIIGDLHDLSGTTRSHILNMGIRAGYRKYFPRIGVTLTPEFSLNSALVDSNNLYGESRSVHLHSGYASWLKTGLGVEKKMHGITLKAKFWRNTTLNDMPGINLNDLRKERYYNARKSAHYGSSFTVDGSVTRKLHIYAELHSSFDGYFKTNCEGMLGIRYNF
ncbi:TPA: autotransporter outer membrane beta-barrel domain-containing protein, partial [Escherichia coli]|nr:autotransporter outer membrane beta-barrel domain-containing protein [Escherichia coli]